MFSLVLRDFGFILKGRQILQKKFLKSSQIWLNYPFENPFLNKKAIKRAIAIFVGRFCDFWPPEKLLATISGDFYYFSAISIPKLLATLKVQKQRVTIWTFCSVFFLTGVTINSCYRVNMISCLNNTGYIKLSYNHCYF